MNDTPVDPAARFLQGVGLAECSLEVVEQRFASYARGRTSKMRLAGVTSRGDEALEFLSLLSAPATRHVAFASGDRLTVLINNERNGSDYADEVTHLPRHLECRFARVLNCLHRTWRKGKRREVLQYGARMFDLHDAQGETLRSLCCVNDGGRWVFHSFGTPHAVEADFDVEGGKPSERFPVAELIAVAAAFGFPLPTPEQFFAAGRYLMFAQDYVYPVPTCTIAEADDPAYGYFERGMGYAKSMDTHAASVVADFERCVEINPDYEPRVREYLIEARRRLGGAS